MLQLSATIAQRQVLSLRIGTPIATVSGAIINPDTLVIEGFYCHEPDNMHPVVLLCQDIREVVSNGFVVNDADALSDPDELVRLEELLRHGFQLLHLPVETVSGDRVGKINDFAYETNSMVIKKIYVSQPFFKHLTSGSLSVDRSQIHETTLKKVIINDLDEAVTVAVTAQAA